VTASQTKLALLLDLAKEGSGEKRRQLLVQITDMFLSDASVQTGANCAAFDDIMGTVVADLSAELRLDLAQHLAISPLPLGRTSRQLAMDEIEIARPVIELSNSLSQNDLIAVAKAKSQDHMMAITKRSDIGEEVAGALVARGEDKVVVALLSNRQAKIDRASFETIVERARTSPVLQDPCVHREGAPIDLLNDLYAHVGTELRQKILQQYDNLSPEEFDAALDRSRQRAIQKHGAGKEEFERAKGWLDTLEAAGELKPALLVRLMREGDASKTLFLLALARLTDVEHRFIDHLMETRDIDALALLCRAADFDRALFLTLSLRIASADQTIQKLEEFGDLYARVDRTTAQRAVRFWKVRAKS
jgi:uncharacterized protein (DUF2336 family)